MVSVLVLVLLALPIWWAWSCYAGLMKNIALAKATGLPYVITPVSIYNMFWVVTNAIFLPLLRKLPAAWTASWIDYMTLDWTWEKLFEPFAKHGDTFITVSPGKLYVWVSSPDAIHQIAQRREAFPKPLETYRILDVFGRNIVTTEGNEWKGHRRVTAPTFNEKNNVLVFAETIAQAQGMIRKWMGGNTHASQTIKTATDDTEQLALHIISRVGFGVQLFWADVEPGETGETGFSGHVPPEGHTMTYARALETLLKRLLWIVLLPKWLLKWIPLKDAKVAYEGWFNWRQYMDEMFAQKVQEARSGIQAEGMDIMGSLVRSKYGSKVEKGSIMEGGLSDSEIFGNAFVMLIAGHETTANSIHFSLMELAMYPSSQRRLQAELDTIFGSAPPSEWNYQSCINQLLGGMAGAVLNEELRLVPPVIIVPKTVANGDQTLVIDGEKRVLPEGAYINLNVVGAHQNPKYWPSRGASKCTDAATDLNDFVPERWLQSTDAGADKGVKPVNGDTRMPEDIEDEGKELGGFTGNDTHASLYRPAPGAFLPFSDGVRSCLGRRLAQVEVVATLATVFKEYSLELAVDEWASDEEVEAMGDEERRRVYGKAQERARAVIKGAKTVITLNIHPEHIPVRLVRRGEERFGCV